MGADVHKKPRLAAWVFTPLALLGLLLLPLLLIERVPQGLPDPTPGSSKVLYRMRSLPGLPELGVMHTRHGSGLQSIGLTFKAG